MSEVQKKQAGEKPMNEQAAAKTVIAQDVEITGQIKTEGSIEVNGKVDGELRATGNAIIGKTAHIKGNLSANSAIIAGAVNGNIAAKDRVEMKSTAKVLGDIKSKRMSVEDGVTFVGKSEVNTSSSTPGAAPPAGERIAPVEEKAVRDQQGKAQLFGKR